MRRDHAAEFDSTAPVTEQASYWWVLLNNGSATAADHRTFGEWVARSPERLEAFLQTARLTRALKAKRVRWPDTPVDVLIREAKAAAAEVIPLPRSASAAWRDSLCDDAGVPRLDTGSAKGLRQQGPFVRPRIAALAVAVLTAVVVGTWFYLSPQKYQTAIGEQRSVVLGDGSLVTLNTSSAIEVRLAKDRRNIRLTAGEALFQVAHDPSRPFDVTTGDTTVRALGTQFNIDRRARSTTVTVVEGKVAVFTAPLPDPAAALESPKVPLGAGEQVTVASRTAAQPVRADLATATAWVQRKLVFEHRSLGEVAEEFNRYNLHKIEIRSADLRSQEVTGVFRSNDPESFMTFLAKLPNVSIERSDDGTRFIITQTASTPHPL